MSEENTPVKLSCRKCRTRIDFSGCEPFSHVTCPVCGTKLRVPKRFGRYLLEKIIGIGGMSQVYRAVDPLLARRVAVKILNPKEGDGEKAAADLSAEAKRIAALNHPGIIPVYDCGVCEGHPYLSMELMGKGSLEFMLRAGIYIAPAMAASYFCSVAEALYYLQNFNIVHHDIKPGNILVNSSDHACISDFDLADTYKPKHPIPVKGDWATPGYASPERLYSGCEDHHGDIFSLGAALYEVISGGKLPFGSRGEAEELISRRKKAAYPPLFTIARDVNPSLSALADRMMAFEINSRPEYPEIIAALKQAAQSGVPS